MKTSETPLDPPLLHLAASDSTMLRPQEEVEGLCEEGHAGREDSNW